MIVDQFEVVIEKTNEERTEFNTFTTGGSQNLFEETFDGTHAGWERFRKDVTKACGPKSKAWLLEAKDASGNFVKVENGEQLNPFLEAAVNSGKLCIRVIDVGKAKSKSSKETKNQKSNEKDLEKGKKNKDEKDSKSSDDKDDGCSYCSAIWFPVRLILLIGVIYPILFAFWLIALVIVLIIEIVWCPFKILCPLCCPCFCCIEEIQKKTFGLFMFVLKSPFLLAKKILK